MPYLAKGDTSQNIQFYSTCGVKPYPALILTNVNEFEL